MWNDLYWLDSFKWPIITDSWESKANAAYVHLN